MGVDTKLYIHAKWQVGDICDLLSSRFGIDREKIKIEHFRPGPISESMWICFPFNETDRTMHFYPHASTPIGSCTSLSLHCDDDAQRILKTIGEAIGGLYEANDANGELDMLQGQLYDEDALSYFLKSMVLNVPPSKRSGAYGHYTIRDLNNHIKDWANRIHKGTDKKYDCF